MSIDVTIKTDDQQVTLTSDEKWKALGNGVKKAVDVGIFAGFLNVLWQSGPESEKNVISKILSPMSEKFEMKARSFNKAILIGAGIGLADGIISTTLGALHRKQKLQRDMQEMESWQQKQQVEKALSAGAEQSK